MATLLKKSLRSGFNSNARPIEALIFDMDGLLVDSEPLAGETIVALFRRHGREVDLDAKAGQRLVGRRMREILAIIAEMYDLVLPTDAMAQEYEELRLTVLNGRLQPMPGAKELIAYAYEMRLPMALATSGVRRYADAVLAETGLAGAFAVEVTGEDVAHGKPAPDVFLRAASRLGIRPAGCVVFEDAPNGIASATAAGMRAVAVPNVYTRELAFPAPPEVFLSDLHGAIAWLQEQPIRSVLENDA
jgi:HAD superfamily hydrolase (TIGR01509 family)